MHQHHNRTSADTLSTAFWADTMSANICEMDFLLGERSAASQIMLDSVRVGSLSIARYHSSGLNGANRRLEHIRKDCLDGFIVTLPLSAVFQFTQNGRECRVLPGQFALVMTARPLRVQEQPAARRGGPTSFHVVVPGPLLRERCPQIDDLCINAFPIQSGAGQMMRSLVAATIRDGAALSDSAANRVSDLLVELIATAVLQDNIEAEAFPHPRDKARAHTLDGATNFIAANLSNPKLDTALVAEHCGVSVRYLQSLFELASMSVAASIRELRLQRCRDSLKNPQLHNRTIGQIAQLWGFADLAHFSRSYKTRFGITPRAERTNDITLPVLHAG